MREITAPVRREVTLAPSTGLFRTNLVRLDRSAAATYRAGRRSAPTEPALRGYVQRWPFGVSFDIMYRCSVSRSFEGEVAATGCT